MSLPVVLKIAGCWSVSTAGVNDARDVWTPTLESIRQTLRVQDTYANLLSAMNCVVRLSPS